VKTVAAVAVATATTATVVATDPVGVWRDRHAPVAATARAQQPSSSDPTAAESAAVVVPDAPTERPVSAVSEPPGRSQKRGRAAGQATAAAAKAKDKTPNPNAHANAGGQGNGNGQANGGGQGKAQGQAKKPSEPKTSNGQGVPAGGQPEFAGEPGPPPHAKAKGAGKMAANSSS
jgi:hypothetical protein